MEETIRLDILGEAGTIVIKMEMADTVIMGTPLPIIILFINLASICRKLRDLLAMIKVTMNLI
jgi:hypothetical protein